MLVYIRCVERVYVCFILSGVVYSYACMRVWLYLDELRMYVFVYVCTYVQTYTWSCVGMVVCLCVYRHIGCRNKNQPLLKGWVVVE
jgi:hypothetical protein